MADQPGPIPPTEGPIGDELAAPFSNKLHVAINNATTRLVFAETMLSGQTYSRVAVTIPTFWVPEIAALLIQVLEQHQKTHVITPAE